MRSLADVSALAERFGARALHLRNARSGKVALQTPARTRLTDAGEAVATWQLTRPGNRQFITAGDLAESMWEPVDDGRTEERRVGKEDVSTGRSRWSAYH